MLDAGMNGSPPAVKNAMTYLDELEAESIHIMREVAAEFRNPVMLYSIGKDSSVMLHLAMKAFHPSRPPFPLLHIDTGWKFREMIAFRDRIAAATGLQLLVHTNEEGRAAGVTPFTHGSSVYTTIMKTDALKQALTLHGFDAAFGGARRDEEKSRAKERIFSFRSRTTYGSPRINGRNCGICSTPASTRANRFASSLCRTGPNSTSGATSSASRSRLCRSISRPPSRCPARRPADPCRR